MKNESVIIPDHYIQWKRSEISPCEEFSQDKRYIFKDICDLHHDYAMISLISTFQVYNFSISKHRNELCSQLKLLFLKRQLKIYIYKLGGINCMEIKV